MAYKFDQNLVSNVLADKIFQQTGVYIGKRTPYYYAVIDPRRHNINVWTKTNDGSFAASEMERYRNSAKNNAAIFCTNGPPMEPPHFPGDGLLTDKQRIYAGFGYSVASGDPWEPYDAVRSGGQQLHAGRSNQKWVFERIGQGSYDAYRILEATTTGVEGLSGCYGIVSGGAVINSSDHTGLKKKTGAAAWCKCPVDPGINTDKWKTEVEWFEEAMGEGDNPVELDGVIIGVAVGIKPKKLAQRIVLVGCSDAVAMDGSDSTLCGSGGKLRIKCDTKKDLVQRWGLYCT